MGERPERLYAIDWLRGIVMVLMALDHCRDYFGDFRVDPTGIPDTTVALFFTRWVTHFCAPVFVFLAGTAAWLYGARPSAARGGGMARRTKKELSRFLWTRGLWLIVLEFTVIYFAWTSSFTVGIWFLQVIAAIGAAMVVLAGLVRLSTRTVGIVGLVIVCGHNLLDPIVPEDLGGGAWIWRLLHEGSMTDFVFLPVGSVGYLMVIYPLLPWIGVMAVGYAFGPWTQGEPAERRARFYKLGRPMVVFGRVPLFYYVAHIALINASSQLFYKLAYGWGFSSMSDGFKSFQGRATFPHWYGHSLWVVYLSWVGIVVALYPLCAWYAGIKQRSRSPLLSYL